MNVLSTIAGMGIDKICNGIGSLAKNVRQAITGELSAEDRAAIKMQLNEIEEKAAEAELKTTQLQQSVIVAEAQGGSWLQRSWRPITMLTFVAIIANNYIIAPYTGALFDFTVTLDIPPDMWGLLKLGIGGYILGRSAESSVKYWKQGDKK